MLSPHLQRGALIASYVLIAAGLLLVLHQGLLPGLLCACVGFLATRWLADDVLQRAWRNPFPARVAPSSSVLRAAAAVLIGLAPLIALSVALSQSRTFVLHAPDQYRDLLDHVARTVLELRQRLPAELGRHLPDGTADVQALVAQYLSAQAGALAITGRAWLHALLLSYVGLLVGVLAGCARAPAHRRPLAAALHARIVRFGIAFRQIVAAQVWIALFNTALTALFLYVLLPVFGMRLPYTGSLVVLTFTAGLVPIVGNLLCNAVITMVGLSVSPLTAAACLAFLIVIHKAEYAINAKVVGSRTHMAVWELLAVMFVAEAIFGPAGLVAAPLYYAYLKKELQAARLV